MSITLFDALSRLSSDRYKSNISTGSIVLVEYRIGESSNVIQILTYRDETPTQMCFLNDWGDYVIIGKFNVVKCELI